MKSQYWDINPILSKNAVYSLIFGERSNGKTYGVLQYGLEEYFKNGSELAIVRRWAEDFKSSNGGGTQMFVALVKNGVVSKLSNNKYNDIYYYAHRWYLCFTDPEGIKDRIVDEKPFAYAFSIASEEHYKSTSYPNIRIVLFDEFLTRSYYLPDEFIKFTSILSTIIRERDNVRIFMCGNTVNKYCPYFGEMGLTNVRNMEMGTIDIYTYGESPLTVAVEYCGTAVKQKNKKKSDMYFAFNNPKLKMITTGTWEIAIYPNLTEVMKYKPENIIYTYFIEFDTEILQCEVVNVNDLLFTFIHRKTTPIKENEQNIVYRQNYDPRTNYRRKITKPMLEIEKRLYRFFLEDKVFYQSNEIGEIVRNYLLWCNKSND